MGEVWRPEWRSFRRLQDSALVFAALIYAAAAVQGWQVLPGPTTLKAQVLLLWPWVFGFGVLSAGLLIPTLRRGLRQHVWTSFRTGFGQGWPSVVGGLGVLAAAAGFLFWQTAGARAGGQYPAGAFSAFGAGLGVLVVQSLLIRGLQRDPELRPLLLADR